MRACLVISALSVLIAVPASAAPDWVKSGGTSARYPASKFLTGFALAPSAAAAKNQAAADLAKRIVVRIEQATTDVTAEKDGQARYEITMMTRATTDVQITNLGYEMHKADGSVYALAYVRRSAAVGQKAADRDRNLGAARKCLKDAKGAKGASAITQSLGCRAFVTRAVEADAVLGVLDTSSALRGKEAEALATLNRDIDARVQALLRRPAASLDDAIETLAIQLRRQGVGKANDVTIAPLTYGTTRFSSPFGRTAATDLTAALASKAPGKGAPRVRGKLVLAGTYSERQDGVRISVVARTAKSGNAVAAARATVLAAKIPKSMPLKPQNFDQALVDSKLLAEGEKVAGGLRVEVWTNKGDRNLVYSEGEEMKIYMRVNRPAYVRLFYLLANKAKVPLEQAYFIDASKVNRAVEYPDAFEVSRPFGVEQIFAVGYTKKPAPVRTRQVIFDGEPYDIVDDRAMVRHRGLKRKKAKLQVSEATVTITTMAR